MVEKCNLPRVDSRRSFVKAAAAFTLISLGMSGIGEEGWQNIQGAAGRNKTQFLTERIERGQKIVRVNMSDFLSKNDQEVRRVLMDLEWYKSLPDKDNFALKENEGICFIYEYDMSGLNPREVGPDCERWDLGTIPLDDGRRIAFAFEVSGNSTKLEMYFACENPQNLK